MNYITDFSNLKEYPFNYFPMRNIRMMRLTDEDWQLLINIMNKTYKSGITPSDLNDIFSNDNIDLVRKWLGKPMLEDEVYPKYYLITSQVKGKQRYIYIPDPMVDGEVLMDDDFHSCNPQYLGIKKPNTEEEIEASVFVDLTEFRYDEDKMWDKYNIPVYAIDEICRKVLDPDDSLDYYDVPESTALNEYRRCLELNSKDHKNINNFLSGLKKKMPEGFDIAWDEESCFSPFFHPTPEFGLGIDCVILRVYPKNYDRLKNEC